MCVPVFEKAKGDLGVNLNLSFTPRRLRRGSAGADVRQPHGIILEGSTS
jgi:hypothetical protein